LDESDENGNAPLVNRLYCVGEQATVCIHGRYQKLRRLAPRISLE